MSKSDFIGVKIKFTNQAVQGYETITLKSQSGEQMSVAVVVAKYAMHRNAGLFKFNIHQRGDKMTTVDDQFALFGFDGFNCLSKVPDIVVAVTHDGDVH